MPQPPNLKTLGLPFNELSSVDSTNNYALAQIREGLALNGEAWFAHEQVAGKGQRNKKWMAAKDSSLILSIAIRPEGLLLTEQFQLSITVAVSVVHFLSRYVTSGLTIKWPNDIYWHDRKAGGILIENIVSNEEGWKWSVIGMGININQTSFAPELMKAVSLLQITGKHFDCLKMAQSLCEVLSDKYQQLLNAGFETIYADYLSMLYKKDEKVILKKDTRRFEAVIKGVDKEGQLVVEHGIEERFSMGEVEWIM